MPLADSQCRNAGSRKLDNQWQITGKTRTAIGRGRLEHQWIYKCFVGKQKIGGKLAATDWCTQKFNMFHLGGSSAVLQSAR